MRRSAAAALCFAASVCATPRWSSAGDERVELRALLETELAVQTTDGEPQKWDSVVTPTLELQIADSLELTAIGRARFDPVDDLEPGRPSQGTRSDESKRVFIGAFTDLELRELYLDAALKRSFVRLGKQQVVWGQADGLRVLDVLNPLSYREFILPDFEDRRIPLWMLNAEVPLGQVNAQLIWIPDQTYDEAPESGATFAFTSPRLAPRPPPDVPVDVRSPAKPHDAIADSDTGVRLSAFMRGWDLTLNYLYHYQDQPVLRRSIIPTGVVVSPEYERTHLGGGTLSRAFGDLTLRGELAYSTRRFTLTSDPDDADGVFRAGDFQYVAGLDYSYDADTLVSGQIFQSVLTRRPTGAARDRVDTQLTLLLQRQLLNNTLEAKVLAIHSANDGDGLAQLDLAYEYRSNIVMRIGYDVFYGSRNGLFGEFGHADRVTFGVEVGM